jgi:PAS domain
LQSINEELQTINSELQGKTELMARLNSDLKNLLDSTQIATVFLDDALRIKHYTPAMQELFSLLCALLSACALEGPPKSRDWFWPAARPVSSSG